jgi:O-methyltransferase involved in polyketide biosynthesis
MVVNQPRAATRQCGWRFPPALRWWKSTFRHLDYGEILGDAKPACVLERVRLDLSNEDGRRGLFADLGRRAKQVAVISEGLVVYLMPDAVVALARDLAGPPAFQHWALDLASPGLVEMMKRSAGNAMNEAGAPLLFAPAEGPPLACGGR